LYLPINEISSSTQSKIFLYLPYKAQGFVLTLHQQLKLNWVKKTGTSNPTSWSCT